MSNPVGIEMQAAQLGAVPKMEKPEQPDPARQAAAVASSPAAAAKLQEAPSSRFPPAEPVNVSPKPGSTIEVVA